MHLISSRNKILTVVKRWEAQYPDGARAETLEKLRALDLTTATAAEVDAIIGNNSWTHVSCDHCNASTEWALQLDNPWGSTPLVLCRDCVAEVASYLPVFPLTSVGGKQ